MFNPPHPGRIVRLAMGRSMTVTALATHLGVTRSQLSLIIDGKAGISPHMSVQLDQVFDKSDGFWLRLQHTYDLAQVRRMKAKLIHAHTTPV